MRAIAATLLLGTFSLAASAAETIHCPASLEIRSAVTPPASWELIPPRYQLLLEGITIYDGHPKEMASLAPQVLPAKDGFEIMRWEVSDDTWLECRYAGTHSTIAKQLPKGRKVCVAYYEQLPGSFGPFSRLECE